MTIKVNGIIYNRGNWQRHCDAIAAVQQRVPEALFDTAGKLWKFANLDDLLKALATLAEADWPASGKPGNLGLKCVAPQSGQRAGTVIVRDQTFENIGELRDLPAIASLAEYGELISSPGFGALARDDIAQRWEFPGWEKALAAVTNWDPKQPYTEELLAYRVPRTPERGDYNLDGLETLDIQRMFGNCGDAASYLIGRVHHKGGKVELFAKEEKLTGPKGAERLKALLTGTYEAPALINVITPILHEFVVERQPDAQALLQQGYQSAYDALWWAGLPGGRSSLSGEDHEDMRAIRSSWGEGKPIDLDRLVTLLSAFMVEPNLKDAGTAWRKLPFLPSEKLNDAAVPTWQVRVWLVREPEQAIGALTNEKTSWVTTAVLREADQAATRQ